jgi:hypothetical protein
VERCERDANPGDQEGRPVIDSVSDVLASIDPSPT